MESPRTSILKWDKHLRESASPPSIHGPVRTFKDMSAEEIQKIRNLYKVHPSDMPDRELSET